MVDVASVAESTVSDISELSAPQSPPLAITLAKLNADLNPGFFVSKRFNMPNTLISS